MQFTKDSFYLALRERMMALNPQRRVVLDGVSRAAIFTSENEPVSAQALQEDSFYLRWGASRAVAKHVGGSRRLRALECVITYRTGGTCESAVDRGRAIGALDNELLNICHPGRSRKRDFTQSPSVDLGSDIFWSEPELAELETGDASDSAAASGGAILQRSARLTLYFFPEVDFS
jgi:hypothetical protein